LVKMQLLKRFQKSKRAASEDPSHDDIRDLEKEAGRPVDEGPVRWMTLRVFTMAVVVSIGGFIFGYDTGQISGMLEMPNFLRTFADKEGPKFSNVRSGTIVALLSIGTLMGALAAAPIADAVGRKFSIVFWNIVFCVGMIVQIATVSKWHQIAIGRWVAGLGVGALSVLVPMYQSETAPKQVRGALVSCYQLFITLGIFVAYCVNFGTEKDQSNRAWRLPMGISFIWPVIMIAGMLFLRESPRWDYRRGRIDRARTTLAKSYGVSENHREVEREVREIREKLEAEQAGGKQKVHEIFTWTEDALPCVAWCCTSGLATTDWCKLLLLLRYLHLHRYWLEQQLCHQHDSWWC